MSIQKIFINVPKDLTKLAGNPFGQKVYAEIKDQIDFDNDIVFVLPDSIDRVASSFVQGFFSELFLKLGYKGISEKIDFETTIQNFKDFVLENLE